MVLYRLRHFIVVIFYFFNSSYVSKIKKEKAKIDFSCSTMYNVYCIYIYTKYESLTGLDQVFAKIFIAYVRWL